MNIRQKEQLVKERLEPLKALMDSCVLCPRECKVNRNKGQKGFCRTANKVKIASWNRHRGEEPFISGTNGSGTIFVSSCTLKCKFCQNFPFSQMDHGIELEPYELAEKYDILAEKRVHNINFVTPTHVVPMLLEAWLLSSDKAKSLPIVYNCSGYESKIVLDLLEGIIDIYLPDIKYADNETALELSSAPNYVENNLRTIKQMHDQTGPIQIDPNTGLATKGLAVRHLVLPNGYAGTEISLSRLKELLGTDVYLSVMCQYFPAYKAHEIPFLDKPLPEEDFFKILDLIEQLGFENALTQDPYDPGGA